MSNELLSPEAILNLQKTFETEILAQIQKVSKKRAFHENHEPSEQPPEKQLKPPNTNPDSSETTFKVHEKNSSTEAQADCFQNYWNTRMSEKSTVNKLFENRAFFIVNPDEGASSSEEENSDNDEDNEMCNEFLSGKRVDCAYAIRTKWPNWQVRPDKISEPFGYPPFKKTGDSEEVEKRENCVLKSGFDKVKVGSDASLEFVNDYCDSLNPFLREGKPVEFFRRVQRKVSSDHSLAPTPEPKISPNTDPKTGQIAPQIKLQEPLLNQTNTSKPSQNPPQSQSPKKTFPRTAHNKHIPKFIKLPYTFKQKIYNFSSDSRRPEVVLPNLTSGSFEAEAREIGRQFNTARCKKLFLRRNVSRHPLWRK